MLKNITMYRRNISNQAKPYSYDNRDCDIVLVKLDRDYFRTT